MPRKLKRYYGSEPKKGNPSMVVHSLKLRVSKRLRGAKRKPVSGQRMLPFRGAGLNLPQFWQSRFYDFNVYSAAKRREKLEYMHRHPVLRRLVKHPKDWVWSSYSSYSETGAPVAEIDYVP